MKRFAHRLLFFSSIAFLFSGFHCELPAQSKDADKLYKKAIKEKHELKRLELLNQALELDSENPFIFFEIGKIFKNQKNYFQAERYMAEAHRFLTTQYSTDDRFEILTELSQCYDQMGNYTNYERVVQEIITLDISDEIRGKLSFELGRLYFKQSRYEEAVKELERGLALDDGNKQSYRNLIKLAKQTRELDKKYNEAEQARLSGDLDEAKQLFLEINSEVPGFKNVDAKLRSIEQELAQIAVKPVEESQVGNAENTMPSQTKEHLVQTPESATTNRSQPSDQDFEIDFDTSRNILDSKERQRRPAEQYFTKNTDRQHAGESLQIAPIINVDSLYNRAIAKMNASLWLDAVIDLETVNVLNKNFKKTDSLLFHAKRELRTISNADDTHAIDASSTSMFFIGASAVFLMPLLSFIFSPTVRAQYFLVRKNYSAAASIYERIVARHPSKKKFYGKLAHIYLITGRVDKAAIQVYKRSLQLNMNAIQRDQIASLVMQKYLKEGNSDRDAIEVLEKVLRQEVKKKQ